MIKNTIEIKADWQQVEKLIDDLIKLKEVRSSINWLEEDWKKPSVDGVMDGRFFDYVGVNYDNTFAKSANKIIIKYIEGDK